MHLLRRKNDLTRQAELRSDLRAGIVASTIYNANRNSKDQPVLTAADFFPELGDIARKEKNTPVSREARNKEMTNKVIEAYKIFGGVLTPRIPEQESVEGDN